jgi:hypothetical protein
MSQVTTSESRLVIGDANVGSGGLHGLSPALIGLGGPIVLTMIFAPSAIEHAAFLLTFILFTILIISVGVYIVSVLAKGPVVAAIADRGSRQLVFVQQGPFASTTSSVAFDQVRVVQIATQYDDDGYRFEVAQVVLVDGQVVDLPQGTSRDNVQAIRRVIGLA